MILRPSHPSTSPCTWPCRRRSGRRRPPRSAVARLAELPRRCAACAGTRRRPASCLSLLERGTSGRGGSSSLSGVLDRALPELAESLRPAQHRPLRARSDAGVALGPGRPTRRAGSLATRTPGAELALLAHPERLRLAALVIDAPATRTRPRRRDRPPPRRPARPGRGGGGGDRVPRRQPHAVHGDGGPTGRLRRGAGAAAGGPSRRPRACSCPLPPEPGRRRSSRGGTASTSTSCTGSCRRPSPTPS